MGIIVLNVGPSETLSVSPQGLCITGMSLQADSDQGSVGVVNVWAEDGHQEQFAIGTLSSGAPIVALRPQVVVGDGFDLRHDAVAATVRFYSSVPYPPPPPSVTEAEEEATDLNDGGEVEVEAAWEEFRPLTEEEEAKRYDSDNDDEEEDDEPPPKVRDGGEEATEESSNMAAPPDGEFFGPAATARFAAVENTSGFMRVATAAVGDQDDGKEITVLYRYTRFSSTWSGMRGVEACRRTKLHRLRFAVPPAGDVASSLAWAGTSLGPLIYPALFRQQLQRLWTTLAAAPPAISSVVPPRATRVQVVVDVGILRREDYTPECMENMRVAMEARMREAWPELCHVGMDLHLPEPVQRCKEEDEQGGDDDTRPAKRRKIVEEAAEECSVCFDPLESGLAAWPGCRHVFHGACVEETLARSDMCPLCRKNLFAGASNTS